MSFPCCPGSEIMGTPIRCQASLCAVSKLQICAAGRKRHQCSTRFSLVHGQEHDPVICLSCIPFPYCTGDHGIRIRCRIVQSSASHRLPRLKWLVLPGDGVFSIRVCFLPRTIPRHLECLHLHFPAARIQDRF